MEEKKPNININVPEKVQSPVFSNVVQVHATDREVVINFAFIEPNSNQGVLVSKVVLTPEHTEAFIGALKNVLAKRGTGK